MILNNVVIDASAFDIVQELRNQLIVNKIDLLKDVKDTTDNVMVTCPYHKNGQERRPSAGIQHKTGMFHCFACGEIHTLPEVISYCFGRYDDLVGAFGWNWIVRNFIVVSAQERKSIPLNYFRNKRSEEKQYVSEEELNLYRVYHPYMWKRKLTPEIVEIFDIGYDAFTQCITFPVRDVDGNCLFVARRSVNTKFFNYPKHVEKPVYGLYELAQLKVYPNEVIICESMIDALTCWVYGKYAVALNGLGSDMQLVQLRCMPCRKFILATDNDEWGRRARTRIKNELNNILITEYVLPSGKKDINDLSKEEFDALEEIF